MTQIPVSGQELKIVNQFKYLGAILSKEGSETEVLGRRGADSSSTGKTETNVERQKHQSIFQAEANACTSPVNLIMHARYGH